MTETRYKIRFWNWIAASECFDVQTEVYRERGAAKYRFDACEVADNISVIELLQERIANGCVIDEQQIAEKKRVGATVFDRITKDAPTLAGLFASLPVLEAPWDTEFQKRYCSKCFRADCDSDSECPNECFRNNPKWWLSLPAVEVEQ